MYQKGDYVVYGSDGPCLVSDVTMLDIPGCDSKREYYILHPMISKRSVIYSPVDNQKVKMRFVMNRDEAEKILSGIGDIPTMKVENEKFREEQYRAVIRNTDFRDWICMMKMLVSRRRIRASQGRKFTSLDEKYLREVGDIASCELSIAFGVDRGVVEEKLRELIG